MNRLSLARRTQIIGALVEGNSIRSTERMTDTHRDTIMRLMVEVGTGCATLANEQMRDLACRRIQWTKSGRYVGKKQAHSPSGDDRTAPRRPVDVCGDRPRNQAGPGLSRRQARPATTPWRS